MTVSSADLAAMQHAVDAEIARARLEELIADCSDGDVIWISDVIQEAFNQVALAARANLPPQPRLPTFMRKARLRMSFKD